MTPVITAVMTGVMPVGLTAIAPVGAAHHVRGQREADGEVVEEKLAGLVARIGCDERDDVGVGGHARPLDLVQQDPERIGSFKRRAERVRVVLGERPRVERVLEVLERERELQDVRL